MDAFGAIMQELYSKYSATEVGGQQVMTLIDFRTLIAALAIDIYEDEITNHYLEVRDGQSTPFALRMV